MSSRTKKSTKAYDNVCQYLFQECKSKPNVRIVKQKTVLIHVSKFLQKHAFPKSHVKHQLPSVNTLKQALATINVLVHMCPQMHEVCNVRKGPKHWLVFQYNLHIQSSPLTLHGQFQAPC